MGRIASLVILMSLLLGGHAQPARANDCPPVNDATDAADADCLNREVPTVDADGQPIPFVDEVSAPPDEIALAAADY